MSTSSRVIKNTGYLYVKMGITMFISLYTTRLILNSLGASDFGIFNIVGGAIAMLGFLNVAMASATQRFMSYAEGAGNKGNEKKIFNVSIILHFTLSIIVGIALLITGFFFFNGILNIPKGRISAAEVVYGSLIISTMFTIMTVPYDATMNAHENMKYYAFVGILESILKLAVAFVTVYTLSDKLVVYGTLMAFIPLITLSIMRIYCHRHYEECVISPRKYWDKSMVKEITSFAGWNFLNSAASIVTQYGLGIVLNSFFGTILNAAMGVANQLSGMLMAFSNSMTKALNPVIVKSAGSGEDEKMINASLIGCKYSYFLIAVFCIPFIFEMPYILKLWLKNIPNWAILFCQLQLIRSLMEGLTGYIQTLVTAKGDIKGISISKSILSILPLLLTFISFLKGCSPYWLYIWWIVCWGVLNDIISLYYAKVLCKLRIKDYMKIAFYPIIIISFAMTFVCISIITFVHESLLRLILTFSISTAAFIFTTYATMSKQEKRIIMPLISKIKEYSYIRRII
jgi:O-antigen/teichoic acid export membrane protein